MKKLIFFTLCLSLCFGAVAEGIGLRINVHPVGYMNHLVRTEHDKSAFAAALQTALDNVTGGGTLSYDTSGTEYYNSFALGLDVSYSYFYYSMSIGFPSSVAMSGFDPVKKAYENLFTPMDKIVGTVLLDNQLGGGITLLETMPVNIYVGGGIAVNYLHAKRKIQNDSAFSVFVPNAVDVYEIKDIAQLGLGVRCSVDYYFLANVGVSLTLTDSLYFANLYSNTKFTGTEPNLGRFEYKLNSQDPKSTENDNGKVKQRIGNNFAIRAGVAFKF